MEYSKEDIRKAYIKLKSYVYYDNTDLLLRKQLVEFETGIGKEFLINNPSSFYNIDSDIFNYKLHFTIEEKFERIAKELSNFHKKPEFFNAVLDKLSIDFYPKKYTEQKDDSNYISKLKISIVTARGAPAHRRVINTMRSWNIAVNNAFFLGGLNKTQILSVLKPHIFFDDQRRHLDLAAAVVPAVHVPFGITNQ